MEKINGQRKPVASSSFGWATRSTLPVLLILAIAAGCRDKTEQSEKRAQPQRIALPHGLTKEQSAQVLAQVGSTTLTLGEFAEDLRGQSAYVSARYSSEKGRRALLDEKVVFLLLAAEAQKRGYTRRADVERLRERAMVEQMMQDLFEKNGVKLSDITEAEIQKYYDSHKNEFEKPAQRRASQIFVKNRETADKILAELERGSGDLRTFARLARMYNADSRTKTTFGDLGFFSTTPEGDETREPERSDAVRKAVFSQERVGDVHPEPIRADKGFVVVQLTGKREALTRSVEEARAVIQNRLWQAKREAAVGKFIAELRAQARVERNARLLNEGSTR